MSDPNAHALELLAVEIRINDPRATSLVSERSISRSVTRYRSRVTDREIDPLWIDHGGES